MKPIRTLDDLRNATDEEVQAALEHVTVLPDLERYLEWLSDSETPTIVTTKLDRRKQRALGIHPSSACKKGVCLLRLYYECTGEIKPAREYEAEMQRIWDLGTLLHDTNQVHFENMYEDLFEKEVKLIDKELHISSHTDGIFSFTPVRIILEMKSIKEGGNFGWAKVQDKPFEDNVRQSHFYMAVADVPFAIIFYIAKNTGKLKEHPIVFDFDLWEEMKTEVVKPVVDAAFNGGPMVEGKPGYDCRWCSFNYACETARRHRAHVKGSRSRWTAR